MCDPDLDVDLIKNILLVAKDYKTSKVTFHVGDNKHLFHRVVEELTTLKSWMHDKSATNNQLTKDTCHAFFVYEEETSDLICYDRCQ